MATLNTPLRWTLLALAGLASFYLALQASRRSGGPDDDLVEAVTRERTGPRPAEPTPSQGAPERDASLVLSDRSHAVPRSSGNAFAVLNWQPPPPPVRVVAPPPPPPPAPPPAPVAPPLPFTFVGLMERGAGKPQAFLTKGDALLVVAAGDLIDNNTYRVDVLGAQQIVLTYLPLNTPQSLNLLGGMK